MFGKLAGMFGKKDAGLLVPAPVAGEAVPISDVRDPTFGEEILGKGVAIRPSAGRVVSPVAGTVETIFETGHAVSLHSDDGIDLLIHVGLDTVQLDGQGYTKHVTNGQRVAPGDLLIEFDLEAIAAAGYDTITPVVVCNSGDYADVTAETGKTVTELADLLHIQKS